MPSSLQYPLERHREVQRFRMPVEPEAPPWFTLVAVSPIITITDWNGTFRAPFLALSDGPETEYVSARFIRAGGGFVFVAAWAARAAIGPAARAGQLPDIHRLSPIMTHDLCR
jgi:hypothetical protein